MANIKLPTNASEWVAYLGTKKLPSAFRVAKQVLNVLVKKDVPYRELAQLINGDPILAYYVMLNANQGREPNVEPSQSMEHGISMIGVEHLADLARHLPFQSLKPDDKRATRYLKSISSSVLAAYVARAIAREKAPHMAKNVYWSTLMYGAPLWYLWRYAPSQMERVKKETVVSFRPREEVETETLGCTIEELARQFTEEQDLPDICRAAFLPKNKISTREMVTIARNCPDQGLPPMLDDKRLNIAMQQPHFLVQLSQLLANYASFDWYSKGTLRVQRAIATLMRVPLDDAIQLTHQAAVDMSRNHPFPGIMLPAGKLMMPPRTRVKGTSDTKRFHIPADAPPAKQEQMPPATKTQSGDVTRANEASKTKAAAPSQPPKSQDKAPASAPAGKTVEPEIDDSAITGDLSMFKDMKNMMAEQPDQFYDLHELMNAAVQGLAYGLGLKRNMVSMVNRDMTRLKMYYQVGCREDGGLANFQMEVDNNSIFQKLIERPASVWIKPSSTVKMTSLIPGSFKSMANSNDYFLMSVFVGRRPVAIFFADNDGDAESALTEAHYHHFKQMCGSVTHVLNNMSDRIS